MSECPQCKIYKYRETKLLNMAEKLRAAGQEHDDDVVIEIANGIIKNLKSTPIFEAVAEKK